MRTVKKVLLVLVLFLSIGTLVSCSNANGYPNPKMTQVTKSREVSELHTQLKTSIEAEEPFIDVKENYYLNMAFKQTIKPDFLGNITFNNVKSGNVSFKRGIKEDYSDFYYRQDFNTDTEANGVKVKMIHNYHIANKKYHLEELNLLQNSKTTGNIVFKELQVSNATISVEYRNRVKEIYAFISKALFDENNQSTTSNNLKVYKYSDGIVYKYSMDKINFNGQFFEITIESNYDIKLDLQIFMTEKGLFAMQFDLKIKAKDSSEYIFESHYEVYSSKSNPNKNVEYIDFANGSDKTVYLGK